MILVAGDGENSGTAAAWEALQRGEQALEAIVKGVRLVETNPQEHYVGTGGLPNALGEVELDAGVMDGRTRASGAVGALHGYLHPVSVAVEVMRRLPHVLLVGEGARRFASELGAEAETADNPLLTAEARQEWHAWCAAQGLDPENLPANLLEFIEKGRDPKRSGGTTVYLAKDAAGDLAAATSTSGWSWKYPGRLGDSPIAGAGFYADSRYGAAACTGTGELSIRTSLARSTVALLETGLSAKGAVRKALQDVLALPGMEGPNRPYSITLYAISADEDYAVGFVAPESRHTPFFYLAQEGDEQPRRVDAVRVA